MRVADWIVARLAQEGVRHIFLLPGGGAMYLNDAVASQSAIEGVACHHEQACGIAAEAYGRTGFEQNPGFGVAMVTTGPGATNVITPVAGAWIDSIPLLIISGQAKRPDRMVGRSIRQGGVQEVDIIPMVKSITKYAVTVNEPADIRRHIDETIFLMKSGRPGPVWIDIPLDVQAATIDESALDKWNAPVVDASNHPEINKVCELLKEAERPLILGGHGIRLSGAAEKFRKLVDHLQVPVVLTWNALDLLPYEHCLNVGRPGVVAARAPNFAVQNCDLLISIGARLDNIVTAYNPRGFARSARKVVVDIDPGELLDKRAMAIDIPLAMDAGAFIDSLFDHGSATTNAEWNARCIDWKTRFTQNEARVFPDSGPISHAHFVEVLSEVIPENTLVTAGSSGLAVEFFFAGFRNRPGQRTFLTSGLGAMGYGLPAAIGACIGNGARPMVAVESDGSLQLNLQELASLAHRELPICFFVMNNHGYASIRNTQRTHFAERYLASGPDCGLNMPSLEKLAQTYGVAYMQVTDCLNLKSQLAKALAVARPCIIDVHLVSNETLEPKCATILRSDGSIVSMPLEDMSPLLSLDDLRAEMIVDLLDESLTARS